MDSINDGFSEGAGTDDEDEAEIEATPSHVPQHESDRRPQTDHPDRGKHGEESDHES
jgi:hypothetical protein